MHTFNRKIVPIFVILNFILSFEIISDLKYFWQSRDLWGPEFPDWEGIVIRLLLLMVMNFIAIAVAKKRYGEQLSILPHSIFVILIPMISPGIMYGFAALISKILPTV